MKTLSTIISTIFLLAFVGSLVRRARDAGYENGYAEAWEEANGEPFDETRYPTSREAANIPAPDAPFFGDQTDWTKEPPLDWTGIRTSYEDWSAPDVECGTDCDGIECDC